MHQKDFQDLFEVEQQLWWFQGMQSISESLLLQALVQSNNPRILDVGCGTGGVMAWLSSFSTYVSGLDISEDALAFCRKNRHESLFLGSATDLPFHSSSFDVVTCLDVLVQLPSEGDDRLALREIHRVLKPGGQALVRVAAYQWMRSSHDAALRSQRRYDRSQLLKLAHNAGFNVLRSSYANLFLFPVAAIHRLILQPLGLTAKGSDVRPLPAGIAFLNRPFRMLLSLEAKLLRWGFTLPFGLSVVLLIQKSK